MSTDPYFFAAHCELQDAAQRPELQPYLAPASAGLEIAKVLARFEGQIDDEWRHLLVMIGGGLIKLDKLLERDGLR